MIKIYFSFLLTFISSAFALCQVTVTFTLTSTSNLSVPPAGLSNVTFNINLSKPSAQVTDGNVFIYAQGGAGGASKLNYQSVVLSSSWFGGGGTQSVSLSGSFSITQSQLNGVSGVVFAQYESSTGVNYKSTNIVVTIPISNNTLTPPSVTSFTGSGNPTVITGVIPTGGTGSYTYQWQSSTTSTTSGFVNVASTTSQNYDPPTIGQTTHYRRIVTSGSLTSTSNVVSIVITIPPISNNSISNSGSSSFNTSGDPSILNGSIPTGGIGSYTYQWQSSTTSATTGFNNIASAISTNYDPPTISQTTYYRRLVTSGSLTSTSNVITITIVPIGSSFDNPISIGNLNIGSTYSSSLEPRGYYYTLNLTTSATLNLWNCKPSGVSSTFNLFDAGRNAVQGGTFANCDYGYERIFNLQPGVYYVVTEGSASVWANIGLSVTPICPIVSTSPNVTIMAGSSTTLSVSGTDNSYTYAWSPSTGLSSTTGASVTASPSATTTYRVLVKRLDNYCSIEKNIIVTVTGSIGSTINNPIVANIGGCGYTSPLPFLNTTDFGNEYGGSEEDIFFTFTLSNASEVSIFSNHSYIDSYEASGLRLILLNNSGSLIDEQYYGWINLGNSGNDDFSYVPLDGTPLKLTLQPGSYFLVVEGTNGYKKVAIGIETPSGYSCRRASNHSPTKTKKETETKNKDQSKLTRVAVYPNPANQFVSFNIGQDATALVYIVNTNGITVKETIIAGTSPTLNISELPVGLYLIKIVQGNKIQSEKILIER